MDLCPYLENISFENINTLICSMSEILEICEYENYEKCPKFAGSRKFLNNWGEMKWKLNKNN